MSFIYSIPPLLRGIILQLASNQYTSKISLKLLPLISSKFYSIQLIDVQWLDQAYENIVKVIRAKSSYESMGHKNISGDMITTVVEIPEIRLYEFNSAVVTCDSSHLITKQKIYIERVPTIQNDLADYRGGTLFEHSSSFALIKKKSVQVSIEEGFFLAGNGASNYYHWLIEIIPKIHFIKSDFQHNEINFLVSHKAREIKNFQEILQKATEGLRAKFTFLEPDKEYLVKKLTSLTTPNILPFNLRGVGFEPQYCIFHPEAINFIRQMVDNSQTRTSEAYSERIYLARRGSIRDYNQEQIFLELKKHGYTKIFIEDYSFHEQANIFRNSKFIIGPTGAAWTNLVFSRKGTKAFCWMAKEIGDFSAFSNLANFGGVDLTYTYYRASHHNTYRSNYHIDTKNLIEQLTKLKML